MSARVRSFPWLAALTIALAFPNRAAAGPLEQARTLFNAGAQAYGKHDYRAAIAAFTQAYALAKRPGIVFSIGQAYRRQYYLDQHPDDLRRAIESYRRYRKLQPNGPRAAEAAEALGELGPIADRLAAQGAQGAQGAEGAEGVTPPAAAPAEAKTRLMVPARVEGAVASLDGAAPQPLPLIAEVKPGKHQVVVSREGYFEERREAVAAAGSVTALDITLRPKPAEVTVSTESGATISVDGRTIGSAPLLRPLELQAGSYLLTATLNGHRAYAEEVTVERGERKRLQADLPASTQRYFSYGVMGLGVAGLAAGGVMTALAVNQENVAIGIEDSARAQDISGEQLAQHNAALERRDRFATAAVIGFAGGAAVGLTGLLLYAFDSPSVEAPLRRAGGKRTETPPGDDKAAPAEPTMEMGAAAVPLTGGGLLMLRGRF